MNNNTVTVTICIDTTKLNTIYDIEKVVASKTRQAAKELATQIFYKRNKKYLKRKNW